MELKNIRNKKHRAIIQSINEGKDIKTVLKNHEISRPHYFWVKRKYLDYVDMSNAAVVRKNITTNNYNTQLIKKSKYIALKLANTLVHKNFTGTSINQLTTALTNVNNIIRLEQGKSTENIAHNVLHNLNENQLNMIKDSIKQLKASIMK